MFQIFKLSLHLSTGPYPTPRRDKSREFRNVIPGKRAALSGKGEGKKRKKRKKGNKGKKRKKRKRKKKKEKRKKGVGSRKKRLAFPLA